MSLEPLNKFIKGVDFNTIKKIVLLRLDELRNFHFSLSNPLFWVFWLIILLYFSRRWGNKKAFSYCLIVAVLLLATTWFENYLSKTSEITDPIVIRMVSVFLITIISIYYFLIKQND